MNLFIDIFLNRSTATELRNIINIILIKANIIGNDQKLRLLRICRLRELKKHLSDSTHISLSITTNLRNKNNSRNSLHSTRILINYIGLNNLLEHSKLFRSINSFCKMINSNRRILKRMNDTRMSIQIINHCRI